MRKKPTKEQLEKAAIARQKAREVARIVSAMSQDQRAQLAKASGLRMIDGHELSVYNQCFLLTQNPNVSILGGFRQWKSVGRCVAKREAWPDSFPASLRIWFPIGKPDGEPSADDLEEQTNRKPRFGLGVVFDIAQTREFNGAIEADAEKLGLPSLDTVRNGAPAKQADVTEGEFQAL